MMGGGSKRMQRRQLDRIGVLEILCTLGLLLFSWGGACSGFRERWSSTPCFFCAGSTFAFFCLKNPGQPANLELNGRPTARAYLGGSFDTGGWTSNNRFERSRVASSVSPAGSR